MVRADSGFYTEALMSYLEEQQLNYIMAVRIDIPTKVPHRSAQKYAINSGAKVAS
jgi:hypothetical protein